MDATSPAPSVTAREHDLSGYIFSVSAGLVGVCLTVIGLFRLTAYLALRGPNERAWHRLERFADILFLSGLTAMVVIGGLIAYELI